MAFEGLLPYYSNFDMLNKLLPDKSIQRKFVDSWKGKYKSEFLDHDPSFAYLWNIRTYKALKEIFSSAELFGESLAAKESNCWASFYFTSYYALFHSFLACVFLLPGESLESLSNITHSKLLHVFQNSFCKGNYKIIDESICTAFTILKYQREYYSYQMPPNHFLYESDCNIKPDLILPDHLRACFQLANLLSQLIASAFEKHHKAIEKTPENQRFVYENFCLANSRKHPILNQYQLHYVDKIRLRETFQYPAPVAIIIELEHFSDEFGLYNHSGFPKLANGAEFSPSGFVYDAIG